MKVNVLVLFFVCCFSSGFSQNFSGQWKGEFIDKSTSSGSWGGDQCEYVIDLDCSGSKVTGYSYTYFADEGKRYYTICRLTGKVNRKANYIEVTEVERTKTNVPARIRNCFQVHRLSYEKTTDSENLRGSWAPAPNQDGNCGFGATSLYRRALVSSFPNYKNGGSKSVPVNSTAKKVNTTVVKNPKSLAEVKKPVIKKTEKPQPLKEKVLPRSLRQDVVVTENTTNKPQVAPSIIAPLNFEKRNNTLLKTLEVDNATIKVDLYDNGEVDGDSISLYYNKRLLINNKRLSEKAITFNLPVDNRDGINELVMYAENLGTIPPNTALMVVTDGSKRYEVRITSDLQKSGTIRFVHRSLAK